MQWSTTDWWGCPFKNNPKLVVGQPNSSSKNKTKLKILPSLIVWSETELAQRAQHGQLVYNKVSSS